MKVSSRIPGSRAWPAALAGAALLAVAIPLATAQAQEKTRGDRCSEMLQQNFGVAELSGVDQHNARNRRSVYATGTLDNGDTVRFRCLFSQRGTPEVEVYTPYPMGSPNPGSKWGSADAYQVPPKPQANPQTTAPSATGKPAAPGNNGQANQSEQAQPEAQGPKMLKPPSSGS
jgi:hypothetical protein